MESYDDQGMTTTWNYYDEKMWDSVHAAPDTFVACARWCEPAARLRQAGARVLEYGHER